MHIFASIAITLLSIFNCFSLSDAPTRYKMNLEKLRKKAYTIVKSIIHSLHRKMDNFVTYLDKIKDK